MTPAKYPYVNTYRDRHGRVRHYFRRGRGKRVPLPKHPGTPEFETAWKAAMAAFEAGETAPQPGADRTIPGSMDDLIVRYLASRGWRELAPKTKETYGGIIERLRQDHGNRSVAAVTAQVLQRLINKKAEQAPHSANNLLKVLRVLFAVSVRDGMLEHNPARELEKAKTKKKVDSRPGPKTI